jgi:hypothetical protein
VPAAEAGSLIVPRAEFRTFGEGLINLVSGGPAGAYADPAPRSTGNPLRAQSLQEPG